MQRQLSQEQLAQKLHVSQQAVTKWETGAGIPDIENLRALSALFQMSLDELLENPGTAQNQEYPYLSITQYDMEAAKDIDLTFAGARRVILTCSADEKLEVELASDQIADLAQRLKVKIDDQKNKLDVRVQRFGQISEALTKEALIMVIRVPQKFARKIELAGNTIELRITDLKAENVEFSGKASSLYLKDYHGHLEINCNEDLQIQCGNLKVSWISIKFLRHPG